MKKSIKDNGSLKNWKLAIENRQLRKMGGVPGLKGRNKMLSIGRFTPLEIMPRCSAAGLDFRIIPAGLNAPLGFELQRLEFLTGFTLNFNSVNNDNLAGFFDDDFVAQFFSQALRKLSYGIKEVASLSALRRSLASSKSSSNSRMFSYSLRLRITAFLLPFLLTIN